MMRPGQAVRLIYINWVLLRYNLDEIILATHFFRPLRFLRYFNPWYWQRGTQAPRGVRIRQALEDLGPIFVKFGQILSTRRDLLPDDIAVELTKLQDRVPPFPGEQARAIVEKAYGEKLGNIFARFDTEPFASASIAQVHGASMPDGREVIVKVLRPGIENVIRRDVGLLYTIAGLAERYWREGRRLRARAVVAEFEKTIFDELDLQREAANAALLKRNFSGSPLLYVPEIDWPHTRRNVMVMERIYGTPINDIERLKRAGTDMKKLSERGVEIFFTQVFRDSFFHADMHPGNRFIDITTPQEPRYLAVDFGIMGTLAPTDQRYLAENFLAFFHRDYRRVAELHVASGWVPADTRVDEFEAAIRTVCEPIFERPLKDISFGHFLLRLFQTARRFHMEVQPQLVLLQKTLLNIEGLGRELYPDLDLWQTAKPFLERWMSEQIGTRSFIRNLRRQIPLWGEKLPQLPMMLYQAATEIGSSRVQLENMVREIKHLRRDLHDSQQRSFYAGVGRTLLLSAALIYGLDGYSPIMVAHAPVLTWIMGIAGVLLLLQSWSSKRG